MTREREGIKKPPSRRVHTYPMVSIEEVKTISNPLLYVVLFIILQKKNWAKPYQNAYLKILSIVKPFLFLFLRKLKKWHRMALATGDHWPFLFFDPRESSTHIVHSLLAQPTNNNNNNNQIDEMQSKFGSLHTHSHTLSSNRLEILNSNSNMPNTE